MKSAPGKGQAEHRWIVDGIEEGVARVEQDGGAMITVPRWLLPPDAREGQCLAVTQTGSGGSSVVTITIDVAATSAALARSKATVEKASKASRKRDPGGDVAL